MKISHFYIGFFTETPSCTFTTVRTSFLHGMNQALRDWSERVGHISLCKVAAMRAASAAAAACGCKKTQPTLQLLFNLYTI